MSSTINIVRKVPFKMFPLNKSTSYSYSNGNPILTLQFSQNMSRVLKSSSLRLCGRAIIQAKNGKNQLPANRFDITGSAQENVMNNNEQVCYLDDKTGVNSIIDYLRIGDLSGSTYEYIEGYNRNQASIISVTNGYHGICSHANMSLTACANNDVMARECSSPIEFAVPIHSGYIESNKLLPLERGFSLRMNMATDSMALFGANADKFNIEISNVFLMGDYNEVDEPMKGLDLDYTSKKRRNGTINSGNDYLNIQLNLSSVQNIFHNFAPKSWRDSYQHNSFSTCPLLETDATSGFKIAKIKQYNINRGAIRFPNNYVVDETDINKENGFQALRSRFYLDSIFPYVYNKHCLISPVSEGLTQMVKARDWKITPQSVDMGLVPRWQKDANGNWNRNGQVESASHCFGIGVNYDALWAGQSANFKNSSYNYNIESEIDTTPTAVYVYCNSRTELEKASNGQVIALS